MAGETKGSDEIVLHLSSRIGSKAGGSGNVDRGLFVILSAVIGASLLRDIARGKSPVPTAVLLGGAAIAFGIYYLLRRSNVTFFLRKDRIGISNSLRIRRTVAIADVQTLVLCSAEVPEAGRALPLLLVVSKAGRCLLRLDGADRLDLAALRHLAQRGGIELQGSWADTLSLNRLGATYPGAEPRFSATLAWPIRHRGATRAVVVLVTIAGFAAAVIVTTHH